MEDNGFVMDSVEQISKMSSISCQNQNSWKSDKRTYIKVFQQKMLITMINKPDTCKEEKSK